MDEARSKTTEFSFPSFLELVARSFFTAALRAQVEQRGRQRADKVCMANEGCLEEEGGKEHDDTARQNGTADEGR